MEEIGGNKTKNEESKRKKGEMEIKGRMIEINLISGPGAYWTSLLKIYLQLLTGAKKEIEKKIYYFEVASAVNKNHNFPLIVLLLLSFLNYMSDRPQTL